MEYAERMVMLCAMLVLIVVCVARCCAENPTDIESYKNMGYVVVTPNGPLDGGDFGRYTPDTRTAGIQEAINYALSCKPQKNLWITGKQDTQTREVTYNIHDSLYIPPAQGFTIRGDRYLLICDGDGDAAIVIDSAMNCSYSFGLICSSYTNGEAVVLVKPQNLLPMDTWCGPVVARFDFSAEAILSTGDVVLQESASSLAGLKLDASQGSIVESQFRITELVGHGKGVYLISNRFGVQHLKIELWRSRGNLTHIQMGDPGSQPGLIKSNHIEAVLLPGSVNNPTGVDIQSAEANTITLVQSSGMARNRDIVFGANARDNLIFAAKLHSGVTNEARYPNNRVITTDTVGFRVPTPEFPSSGRYVANMNPYPVEVFIVTPGEVSSWSLRSIGGGSQIIDAPLSAGERFILGPGDEMKFDYTEAPTWRWRALP